MTLPTPLTVTQVDGQQDEGETKALFLVGPLRGLTLLISSNDANLYPSIQDGSVMVNRGEEPVKPNIDTITPNSGYAGGVLQVYGSGFAQGGKLYLDGTTQMQTVWNEPVHVGTSIPLSATVGDHQVTYVNPNGLTSEPVPITVTVTP